MFQEDFLSTAFRLQQSLEEPLFAIDTNQDITQLGTALGFNENGVPSSYEEQIMDNFIIYPGPTETLIQDLDWLLDEGSESSF